MQQVHRYRRLSFQVVLFGSIEFDRGINHNQSYIQRLRKKSVSPEGGFGPLLLFVSGVNFFKRVKPIIIGAACLNRQPADERLPRMRSARPRIDRARRKGEENERSPGERARGTRMIFASCDDTPG